MTPAEAQAMTWDQYRHFVRYMDRERRALERQARARGPRVPRRR